MNTKNSTNNMKLPTTVLIIGSGGLRIGQAGEFDYSGSQAIKALKEEGIRVLVMNPNIATVQTDQSLADEVYLVPLTVEYASQIIDKERPDAILLSFGGQTALNLGLALEETGVLKKYGVRVLGTPVSVIRDTEDRERFVARLAEIGVTTARSVATHNKEEALKAADMIGYPVMIRSGFALGGAGSGVVRTKEELAHRLVEVFRGTSQVLVEEYLLGWKEVEYEVVRDSSDNTIVVCNMENIDPMGVHTGESAVVAPSQTLNNEEYHRLREIAVRTIRHLGVVGECNIQYALHPTTGDYRVIEVNARLSRSSALASKATGYPLAFIAAKLALGYQLTELTNNVTKTTTACFEPALDYLVLKLPRWDITKFEHAGIDIGTEMKSVGEVMAIGRSFEEVLQKALRMLAIGADGFCAQRSDVFQIKQFRDEIARPTTRRLFAIAEALRQGVSVKKIHEQSHINTWFLDHMRSLIELEHALRSEKLTPTRLLKAKRSGFSDQQIATCTNKTEASVRKLRVAKGILPVVKQIDTLAGEFPAQTNYLYMTYHGSSHDIAPSIHSMAVLGSGPYSIGSSVEFDWSCVQALKTLGREGYETIMINYNPETVSTDYDMSDRLYFEELSLERVLDIVEYEKPQGVVVSAGGQLPNNLAMPLYQAGVPISGTSPIDIDRAENRHIFSALLDQHQIDQPPWTEVTTLKKATEAAERFGYPVVVRPSYVLSGSAMNVAFDQVSLVRYLKQAVAVSREYPVVVSKFIENAREIEMDCVAQDGKLMLYAITEHVENAGTHSGDATVVMPPQRTYLETIRRAKGITKAIIKELNISGPCNIQFLAHENKLQVIECNVRASRSFPFVSKTSGYNFIELAIEAMLGRDIAADYNTLELDHVAVKSPQFSYQRIKGADPLGNIEMASTGEVACFGHSYAEALLSSMQAAGFVIPEKTILVSLGGDENKVKLLPSLERLHELGYQLYATEGTAAFLKKHGMKSRTVSKIQTGNRNDVLHLLRKGVIDMIINIPIQPLARDRSDGFVIRRAATDLHIPLITNRQLAEACVTALYDLRESKPQTLSWRSYLGNPTDEQL